MISRFRRGILPVAGVLLWAIGVSAALPGARAQTRAANPSPPGHVLLLYSNVFGLPAHRKTNEAFLKVLETAGVSPAVIHHEYLDLVRNNTPAYRQRLPEWLREKYAGVAVAVIVTVDGAAQDFMIQEGRDLFPEVPIVSVLSPKQLEEPVTGRRIIQIPAKADFSGTLKVALELFPATRRVFFVIGASEDEKQWLATAQQAFAPWAATLQFEYSNELTHAELLRRAAALPADSIVFYLSVYRDKEGRAFVPRLVAEEVVTATAQPVFGIYDGLLGAGVIGGSVFSYEAEGERSGEMARDILAGKLVVTEPLTIVPCVHKLMFDWKQLERRGVSRSALPAGSIVVSRPVTIWQQYKWHVILATGGLFLQSVLIALLLIHRQFKRRVEAEHRQSEAALHQQLSRLNLLNQITRAIAERHESESMVRVVLKQLVDEFPLAAALLALFDREADVFTVKIREGRAGTCADSSTWAEGAKIPAAEAGLRRCLSGETLLVRDAAAEDSAIARELDRQGMRSLVAAPLAAGERFFGVLLVVRCEPDGFAAGEVDFMRQLSEHLALAMHQAQLYENLRVAYE
jgi:hypothetical protein